MFLVIDVKVDNCKHTPNFVTTKNLWHDTIIIQNLH